MKQILTISKVILLVAAAVGVTLFLMPVTVTIPDLPPLEEQERDDTGSVLLVLQETELERETFVATLFGWVAPKLKRTPGIVYTGPPPTPPPPIDAYITHQRGYLVQEGLQKYLFKDIRINKTFWAAKGEVNDEGWIILEIQDEYFLMKHNGARKRIRKTN